MRPVGSSFVLAALALAAPAHPQSSSKLFKRAGPLAREATLDLATGTYQLGPRVRERGGYTVADFQNLDAFDGTGFGWLSVDTGGGSCRWFTAGSKGFGSNQSSNASDLMTDVVFFYCSNALDVNSGGAGGSVTLGFYEGYTVFGGAPTTVAAVVSLTGMPANTADGSFFSAGAGCYGLRVIFPTLVAFADNVFIGYSWQFDDVGTVGPLGNTYPFLSCVFSCSGAGATGVDGQGMIDAMDQFCTTPPVSSTFSFGTVGAPFSPSTTTSVNMQIEEAGDLATTNVNYNATVTPNADTLSATKATLGSTWTATLTRAVPSVAGSLLVTVKRARHPLPNGGNPVAPVTGRVLIAGTFLSSLSGSHDGTTGSVSASVPLAFAFCGLHFAAQCRTSGGGFRLSSGVEGTIGTF